MTIFTSTTLRPPSANTSLSSASVTLYDKFPTYSLVPISFSLIHRFGRDTALSGGKFSQTQRRPTPTTRPCDVAGTADADGNTREGCGPASKRGGRARTIKEPNTNGLDEP